MFANPILKSLKSFNYYLLFWAILAIIFILLIYLGTDIGLTAAIADGVVYNLLLSGLGLTIWYPARYIPIEKNSPAKIFTSHFIGAATTTTLWLVSGYFLMVNVLSFEENYPTFLYSTLAWRILIGILFYSLFVSFYYMIIYYEGFQERTRKETELKGLVTEAELRSLKFQINPHFIFNSLNSMSALHDLDQSQLKHSLNLNC